MKLTALFFPVLFILINASSATAQQNDLKAFEADDAAVEKLKTNFCKSALPIYQEILNWIKANKTVKEEAPEPPDIDPYCVECGKEYRRDASEQKADAFIQGEVFQPEAGRIKEMLEIMRAVQLLGENNIPCAINAEEGLNAVRELAERIWYKKVLPMAKKYKTYPKKAYAGMRCLLSAGREMALLGYPDNESISLVAEWLQTFADSYLKRLTKEYQYQLYPSSLSILRQLALCGGNLPENIEEWITKCDDFMHFKIKVEFEATGHGKDNGAYHALIKGEGELYVYLSDNRCYSWQTVNADGINFSVEDVTFTSDQGKAVYQSPKNFRLPLQVSVGMCDNTPVFQLTFEKFSPPEETYVSSDGVSFQQPLLQNLAYATLGSANMEQLKKDASGMEAVAQKHTGDAVLIDSAAKRLRMHQNDSLYLKSPQGKKDMAMMKQMEKETGYSYVPDKNREKELAKLHVYTAALKKREEKMKTPGYVGSEEYFKDQQNISDLQSQTNINKVASYAGININMLKITAPFKAGVKMPVDVIQKDKMAQYGGTGGGWELGQFHVTVEHLD